MLQQGIKKKIPYLSSGFQACLSCVSGCAGGASSSASRRAGRGGSGASSRATTALNGAVHSRDTDLTPPDNFCPMFMPLQRVRARFGSALRPPRRASSAPPPPPPPPPPLTERTPLLYLRKNIIRRCYSGTGEMKRATSPRRK